MADGRAVRRMRLAWPGGLAVEVLEYGAAVRSLKAPARGAMVETVLGFAAVADYEADRGYQGRAVGRCANRIDGARFSIDGQIFEVSANEGRNCLHGGALGFSKRLWRFVDWDGEGHRAVLAYESPDGEEGFPGRVQARITFALPSADSLAIEWEAHTDRPTPVNLSHHLYFNLSGDPARPTLDHTLAIAAGHITPVREDLIPTGLLKAVDETPFDLRRGRRLADIVDQKDPQLLMGGGIDHNWVLDGTPGAAAVLTFPETGLTLRLSTDQPGLQVYSGQGLEPPFVRHGGIALEPQAFPDAVNRPDFPDVVLRPGQAYRRQATYRFSIEPPDQGP